MGIMRKINVAISINSPSTLNQSIWSNGASQHVYFLYMLMRDLMPVSNCWITTDSVVPETSVDRMVEDFENNIQPINKIIDEVDLLIEMGSYIAEEYTKYIRKRGGKVVSYKFGNDYVLGAESICFDAHKDWFPHPTDGKSVDEVWTNAQFEKTCKTLFEYVYRAPVHILPHLWDPFFINKAVIDNPETKKGWPYKKRPQKMSISIFEPNICVTKNILIPFLAASKFYDANQKLVERIYMFNTLSYCQIWCLRFVGHAAIWFWFEASIPSLNVTPVMTLAR